MIADTEPQLALNCEFILSQQEVCCRKLFRSPPRNGGQSFKTDESAKKILRLELRTKARDAHKALQNITTSTNALRSPNKGKETSAGSQQTTAYGSEFHPGNKQFNQLGIGILCGERHFYFSLALHNTRLASNKRVYTTPWWDIKGGTSIDLLCRKYRYVIEIRDLSVNSPLPTVSAEILFRHHYQR